MAGNRKPQKIQVFGTQQVPDDLAVDSRTDKLRTLDESPVFNGLFGVRSEGEFSNRAAQAKLIGEMGMPTTLGTTGHLPLDKTQTAVAGSTLRQRGTFKHQAITVEAEPTDEPVAREGANPPKHRK